MKISTSFSRSCEVSGLLIAFVLAAMSHGAAAEMRFTMDAIEAVELQPLSKGGATLFTHLESTDTGIDLQIDIDVGQPRRRLYEIAFAGAGIAVADYDGDGLPDIFMSRHDGPDALYRQVGNIEFVDVSRTAGLGGRAEWSAGATFVDINNDGLSDLYVCYYDSPNALFINNGDGTFSDKAADFGLDFRGASVMAAFADYDRDGDLDVYLLTSRLAADTEIEQQIEVLHEAGPGGRSRPVVQQEFLEYTDFIERPNGQFVQIASGQQDILFRNDDGHFSRVDIRDPNDQQDADNHMGMGLVWWDYNGDQWPDLYVANDLFGPDRLYRNNGDGTFSDVIRSAMPHTPWFSMGVDFADINNDGKFDLMATDMAATSHYAEKVGMGDMAKLGWFLQSADPQQYMRNAVYLNSGVGKFMEVARLAGMASTDWTWSVKLNDFDNDGLNDVFITNGMVRNFMDADTQREIDAAGSRDYWEILKDKPVKKDSNLAFRNAGGLQFDNVAADWGVDHLGLSFGAAVADLDRDGDLDLIVNNLDEPAAVYRNDSQSGGRVLIRLKGTASNRNGIGATVRIETDQGTQVRQLSPTRGFMSADEPLLHFGTGASTKLQRLVVAWPSGQEQVFEDLPVDRYYTITEAAAQKPAQEASAMPSAMYQRLADNELEKYVHRELQFDDYAQQPLLPAKLSQLGPGIAWGDADNDGDDDVFIGGAAGTAGMLYLAADGGEFRASTGGPWEAHSDREDMGVLWLDVDADNDLDLLVVSGGVEVAAEDTDLINRLYLNDGSGQFLTAPAGSLPTTAVASGTVAAADFDGDGDLDVFIGGRSIAGEYPLSPESQLLRNDGGIFTDVTDEIAPQLRQPGMVTSALWTDADGDIDPDLMLTLEWGPVRYFENNDGKLTEQTAAAGLATRTGWWNSIVSVDVDNDGDSDYVVTNVGLNTKYKASVEEPAILYYGDFARSGHPNLVEVHWEDDVELPVRGLSCSSGAMPFIADEYGSFDAFARADIEQLFAPAKVATVQQFKATELRHGVLINNGDASFQFRPLPALAQIAPAFGAVSGDFDLDGNADIFLVQNSFSPQAETGHMDGGLGLLLRGDGNAVFEAVWPDASGLIVTGDAKALTTVDLNQDGRADFLISRNNDTAMVFSGTLGGASEAGTAIAVRLVGRPGNPTGVGARITVIRADGSRQSAEIHAGAGYLSQSAPLAFFASVAGNPVESIQVDWPDGQSSNTVWNNEKNIIIMQLGQ